MPRRRFQRGSVYREGNWWRVRWREDVRLPNGSLKSVRRSTVVGPCRGPGAISRKEAGKRAWDTVLSHVNANASVPASMMTVGQFITQIFEPEVVWTLKHAGKLHYQYAAKKIIKGLGDIPLRDLKASDIQAYVRRLVETGYRRVPGIVRTALHTIIEHAKRTGHFTGDNPAALVRLPHITHQEKHALTWEEAGKVVSMLPSPYREMALLSLSTSLNVAELTGLVWKRVNLTDQTVIVDGDVIPPFSLAVRVNYYRGVWDTTKVTARNRIQPIPAVVVPLLAELSNRKSFTGPDDPVFASRTGTPVDAHNINNRWFKKIGKKLGVKVSWHIFRHTCATMMKNNGVPKADRIAIMGHSQESMTEHYTHSDIGRRREFVDGIAGRLFAIPESRTPEEVSTPSVEELEKLYEKE